MKNKYKKIYKLIKRYPQIVIARHIGPDPDAIGGQLALKELILNTFPQKEVYSIGKSSSRFKFLGQLDKLKDDFEPQNSLLIVIDTPDIKRIDDANPKDYAQVIKIDHHPFIDKYGTIEVVDENASSSCQLILELIYTTKFKLTKEIAEKLYIGIASDTERFLHPYTTARTFQLVSKLIADTNLNFTNLYESLYTRPLNEIRFKGYIFQNITVTENGVAYIKITDEIIKEYKVDTASAGNMINDLKYVNEIKVWVFLTEDIKTNLIRVSLRSNKIVINELATTYGGGGHKYAAGARLSSWIEADNLIEDLNKLAKKCPNEKD